MDGIVVFTPQLSPLPMCVFPQRTALIEAATVTKVFGDTVRPGARCDLGILAAGLVEQAENPFRYQIIEGAYHLTSTGG
jgi:hypothetical protein